MGNSCACIRQSEGEASKSCKFKSTVEEQIEKSKSHWSTLADQSGCMDEGEDSHEAEVSNVEEFRELQRHPTWGDFFATFGHDLGIWNTDGDLVIGEKFAEGGQAELFHAHVTWWDPKDNEESLKAGHEYVLKVFKRGTFLKHLKSQLPHGFLQMRAEELLNWNSPTRKVLLSDKSQVYRGILLKDGRFAFLMEKENFDLRSLIERNLKLRGGEEHGAFSKDDAEIIMYRIALGLEWLHNHNIIHRDLKSSNVLVHEFKRNSLKSLCVVADYECSIGVVGTGFFRAPEILQACRDRVISQKPEVFSKATDVYAYGMTCYEVLTTSLY